MKKILLTLTIFLCLCASVRAQQPKENPRNIDPQFWRKVDLEQVVSFNPQEVDSSKDAELHAHWKFRRGELPADYDHVKLLHDEIEVLKKEIAALKAEMAKRKGRRR
jgi:hypothetical protein